MPLPLAVPPDYPLPAALRARSRSTLPLVVMVAVPVAVLVTVAILLGPGPGLPRNPTTGELDYTRLGAEDWPWLVVPLVALAALVVSTRAARRRPEPGLGYDEFVHRHKDWVKREFRPWAASQVGDELEAREAEQLLRSGSFTRRDGRGGSRTWALRVEDGRFAIDPLA